MGEITNEDILRIFDSFTKDKLDNDAIIMIPTINGYDCYKVDNFVANMAIKMNESPLIK